MSITDYIVAFITIGIISFIAVVIRGYKQYRDIIKQEDIDG